MTMKIKNLELCHFKAFNEKQAVKLSDINIFMGANSSGKSSCIQSMLALKQTYDSKQAQIGLLLTGKYATLGSFKDVINYESENASNNDFSIGVTLNNGADEESCEDLDIIWTFRQNSSQINEVGLQTLEIKRQLITIALKLENEHEYRLFIDNKKQPQTISMNNMIIDKVTTIYNNDYNLQLIEFLNDILKWASGNNYKQFTLNKKVPVVTQLDRLSDLIGNILREQKSKLSPEKERTLKIGSRKAFEMVDLIVEKINLQASETNIKLYNIYNAELLLLITEVDASVDEIEKIINRYKNINPNSKNGEYSKVAMPLYTFSKKRVPEKDAEYFTWSADMYNRYIDEMLESIKYLGPLREMPKSLYQWNMDVDPEYVGAKGEYFASVLSTQSHKKITTMLPGKIEPEEEDLYEALNRWCEYLGVATEINVSSKNSFGINITVHNNNYTKADIVNVGVGTSQVLPVLIMGLLSPSDALIIYEQPELHLHPYSQSRLADFFVAMSKLGKQFIVETHSEYMLHRFRYHLLRGDLEKKKIKLNFFANELLGTKVYEGSMNENGGINYPKDFVDQNQQLFLDMLKHSGK